MTIPSESVRDRTRSLGCPPARLCPSHSSAAQRGGVTRETATETASAVVPGSSKESLLCTQPELPAADTGAMTDSDCRTVGLLAAQPIAANDEQPIVLASDENARVWRSAFDAQLTTEMMDDVVAYAARRASWIETATGVRDPQLIDELVQNALGDTFAQTVVWDPVRCDLALHLKGVIRSRCSHELDRAATFVHSPIETEDENVVADAMSANAPANANELSERCVNEFHSIFDFSQPTIRSCSGCSTYTRKEPPSDATFAAPDRCPWPRITTPSTA